MSEQSPLSAAPRGPGRPKATRVNPRQAGEREPVREAVRDTPEKRQRLRKGIAQQSPTHIPREMIPPGIDLQWVTDTIHGQPEVQTRMSFEINGWRPVTPDMFGGLFDGMFMPRGYKGEINVLGQVLMERPLELTIEARQEERAQAVNARIATETKLRSGQIEGVTFDTQHETALKYNKITHERVQMPVAE